MVPQVSQKNQIEAMVLVVNSCRQSNAYVSSEKMPSISKALISEKDEVCVVYKFASLRQHLVAVD